MKLRDYQISDVNRIKNADCMAIFSEQRTGKTPTAIMGLQAKGIRRPLIVCPASLMYAWKAEYEAWTGQPAWVVNSVKDDMKAWTDGALIVNYEKLRNTVKTTGMWKAILDAKPEAVVLDEAHRIKTRPSRSKPAYTTQACFKLIKVPVRLALTGTPAPNREDEVYNILHFLFPDQYKSYWKFIEDYFITDSVWTPNGAAREVQGLDPAKLAAFQANMDIHCIQHKREEVMTWLTEAPEPTLIKLPVNKKQERYIHDLEAFFETEHVVTDSILTQLVRVRQICAAPAILGLSGDSPKLKWLKQYVKDNPDKAMLIFSNSTKFLMYCWGELFELFGGRMRMITGELKPKMRKQVVDDFQTWPRPMLLFGQTQACKEGLTLDRADVTIFLDVYPPAADYSQAKDRMVATAPERVKPKEIIHVMMADTYDEQLYNLVGRNIDATAVINDYINYIKGRHVNDR